MLHSGHYQHWFGTSSPLHLSPGGAAALLLLTLQNRHDYKHIFMKTTTLPSYLIQSRLTQSQHSTVTLTLHPSEVPKPQFKHCIALVHSKAYSITLAYQSLVSKTWCLNLILAEKYCKKKINNSCILKKKKVLIILFLSFHIKYWCYNGKKTNKKNSLSCSRPDREKTEGASRVQ